MEEYAEELRTPPVPLVSLVGMPELHQTISASLHSEQPPINTLALPDFTKVSIIASSKEAVDSGKPAAGIMKREWLAKHRTRVPAVVAALFSSGGITGDPAQWLQVCTDLDSVKVVVRGKNTKLVLVIVQSSIRDEVSEDHMLALRKRAEIDSKYIITLELSDASEKKRSLQRLSSVFAELATVYYREEGKRVKIRVEKKSFGSPELHVRYCFKAAVFAEFRRDWAEALKLYSDAYAALYEMTETQSKLPPVQRLVEMKTVAEHLHFKVSTLLLHGGKVLEAVKGFQRHIASSEPLVGSSPEVDFLHWEWLGRQFLVFAELLETSSAAVPSSSTAGAAGLTEWDFQPAYFYQMSAHYLKRKKDSLDRILSTPESSEWQKHSENAATESIVPSIFVGQFSRLLDEEGDSVTTLPLADAEYAGYAIAEAQRFQDSFEIIALYRKSMESFTALKATRMASFCANRMAREHLAVGDFASAKKSVDQILPLYRQEGWLTLHWEALGFLRESSRRLGLVNDFVQCSLEMAALSISDGQLLSRRGAIQEEVVGLLRSGATWMKVDQPVDLDVGPASPLRSVFLASVAFHEVAVKPGSPSTLTLSLLSMLPQPIEIDQLEVRFNQPACDFTVGSVSLTPRTWLRLTHEVQSAQSGKLDCLSVTVKMGPWCKIRLETQSPALLDSSSPLINLIHHLHNQPAGTLILSAAGQKFILVDDPDPEVDLTLPPSSGPALVGEVFRIPVTVASRSAAAVLSGELKINLVDATAEAAAPDALHVELLGVTGRDKEEAIEEENIERIRHSFGLVSVPALAAGESWSGELLIRWRRPRVVILYVSLSYSTTAGQRVNIHRNLQIEGTTPLTIAHRFTSPFRCEPLLLSKLKTQSISLAQNEPSVLVLSALNCCHETLRVVSLTVEDAGETVRCATAAGEDLAGFTIAPGEEFRRFFSVIPGKSSSKIDMGYACLRWRRLAGAGKGEDSAAVEVKQKLPEVAAEAAPLVVKVDCPAYAVLGEPFTLHVRIQNESGLLQEMKYSVGDCQGFVFSGPHQDKIWVLPRSQHVASHKVVPLASGQQRLPPVNVTSTRYSAKVSVSAAASTVFVFPSSPPPLV